MPQESLQDQVLVTIPGGPFGSPHTGMARKKTLEQMRTKLNTALGDRDDLEPEQLDGFINDAYRELYNMLDVPELRATVATDLVAGSGYYELPEGVGALSGVAFYHASYSMGVPIEPVTDRHHWRRLPTITGWAYTVPSKYYREGRILAFWPTPDTGRIAVDFRIDPLPLTADDHQSILDAKWDVPLEHKARAEAHRGLLEPELAGVAENDFVASIRTKLSDRALEQENQIMIVTAPRSWRELRGARYPTDE